jgi:hypothetical protein
MTDILDDLRDLHKQATTERSHYYVAKCCERAIEEIEELRHALAWCGGSADFGPGGIARKGWEKVVRPLLNRT